jgi:hypothetical protein
MYLILNTDIIIHVIVLCTVAGDKKGTIFVPAALQNLVLSMHGTEFHVT